LRHCNQIGVGTGIVANGLIVATGLYAWTIWTLDQDLYYLAV